MFARLGQISPKQFRALGFERPLEAQSIEQVTSKEFLARFDVVIVALNGLRTRRFMTRFQRLWSERDAARPITVSLYPGLIFRFHLEGMQSRMSCDLVLLNSPRDLGLYADMVGSLGADNNAVLAGLSFLPGSQQREAAEPPGAGKVVFVGQPTVPAGRDERRYIVDRMIRLARRFPDTEFVIKPRHRPAETTLHKVRHHFAELVDERGKVGSLPGNLGFSYESMADALRETRLCLTFSSTAALEAIGAGIPTRILTDIGINENIGNHFFIGSGLMCDLDDVRPDMPFVLDADWFGNNVAALEDNREAVGARIAELLERQAGAGRALPVSNRRLFGRAPGFTEFVEAERGWPMLEQFGDNKLGRFARLLRLWTPVHRTIRNRVRR